MTMPTVLITGASGGLGAATARIAAQLDARVVLVARSGDALRDVAAEIHAAGGSAHTVSGDVRRAADCQRMVAAAIEQFGQLDAVINSAGILGPMATIADADPEAWERNLATNVLGPVMLTRAALPHLRPRQGRVLYISSRAAVDVIPGWAAYGAAKAALNHATRILAAEEPEITAIALYPGLEGSTEAPLVREDAGDEPLPPEVPGCALAVLALYAPHQWSGSFLPWNHEEIQSMVRRYACLSGT